MATAVLRKLRLTLEMIRFEHSIFALPFALTGALLAWRVGGSPTSALAPQLGWIVVCMVAARSAAMAFNRLLDADIDARNPRTRSRHLPAGLLSVRFAWGFTILSSIVFLVGARALNPLCFYLAPIALAILFFYSYTKRFTSFSHVVLGFCLGIAPAAAWIAITGGLDPRILALTLAVTLWTAGFDIIYSCQDFAFDQQAGLHSMPARLGIAGALVVARTFHVGMLAALAWMVFAFGLGLYAWLGILAVAALLAWEHSLVRADDLSRVNAAFFTANGYVSILFFLFWSADILWNR
ncbi:MAG: putative 4-hydroxybenzoate polyprenyltransferase [Bryobacterales bacterium]|jgi:4-hydroxybenzoate polyprenyltransferase|nr:putative 4-hydroxybenzoate polyprenyltransferase [Bryobacterales bacterium]